MEHARDLMAVMQREMQLRKGVVDWVGCTSRPGTIAVDEQLLWLTSDGFVFRTVGHGAKFHYRLGHGLVMDLADPDFADEAHMHLQGTVFGAIAWLNGFLPLHASAIAADGRVIAFTAPSGGGKSTLAAALVDCGHGHVCDDTLVLDPQSDGVLAMPDNKPLKLWEDSFTLVDAERGEPIHSVIGKFRARPGNSAQDSMPLTDLVFLETGDTMRLEALSGAQKAAILPQALYRATIHAARGDTATHARFIREMARQVRFWRFTRPLEKRHFADSVALVEREVVQKTPALS